MQPKEGVIDLLNAALTTELTAINQYFLAAKLCGSWGFGRLEARFRALSVDEMKDTEDLMAHILYLEALPNMQRLNLVQVGENVPECLQAGLNLERGAVDFLRGAIEHCARVGDYTTRAKFEEMIQDQERHVDWFETQLETIRLVGLERYLSQQITVGDSD
jgi:bacterioferritin